MEDSAGLVEISLPTLAVSLVPLVGLAVLSHQMGMQLESPIIVGIIRTFVQLSILGAILTPIFIWGTEYWEVVAGYLLFMIVLASYEASCRTLYYFKGMSAAILCAFLLTICSISIFSFGLVIQPTPLWAPQYVIPVVGMLLGNCISGVALAMNAILSSFVEQSAEIELYLSFGANSNEASARITQEAVRVGAMPQLNGMAVIGLISIPGMMTGQILGGSPVWEAARYQMLICYLISTVTFGTILVETWIARQVAFTKDRLDRSCFIKRPTDTSFLNRISAVFSAVSASLTINWFSRTPSRSRVESVGNLADMAHERTPFQSKSSFASSTIKGRLELVSICRRKDRMGSSSQLELRRVSRTITTNEKEERALFRGITAQMEPGEILAVHGPSGVGKSQLLRLVAGLSPMDQDGGDVWLNGEPMSTFTNLTLWRRQVRYVSQYKIDIPGTPRQFVAKVSSFASWQNRNLKATTSISLNAMLATTAELIREWGLDVSALDSEWKNLSGGEAQRVYLAIAVASRPAVLLLDESTSALDMVAKKSVEKSIEAIAAQHGISVMMITHDQDQVERMGSKYT